MATKIILTQEVIGLGSAGDIVEVKDGYARNYLVPRGDAIRWTKGGEKQVETIKAARKARALRDADHANEVKAKLEAAPVALKVKAGKEGRLFGSVTVADVAEALAAAAGQSIDKRTVVIGNPIKALGAHQIIVKLHDEVSATVAINVVAA
ncbi:50S ribosomal protein L9 [Nocardioides sp.]|jgi:large subunit ribosomal protein L9|uniref:50S ribosomal protein L9 n=1 Tax=Nocardioides sp. TaxID=35761 RepID=UPI00262C1AE6|nr:50S ribosomal protein L9 [Nocardioides sp.]